MAWDTSVVGRKSVNKISFFVSPIVNSILSISILVLFLSNGYLYSNLKEYVYVQISNWGRDRVVDKIRFCLLFMMRSDSEYGHWTQAVRVMMPWIIFQSFVILIHFEKNFVNYELRTKTRHATLLTHLCTFPYKNA